MPTHRINKVVLDFSFPAKEKDAALQKTKEFFYERMLPKISAGFDGFNGTLHIDQLVIDLGKTTAETFEADFIKAFAENFHSYTSPFKAATAAPLQSSAIFTNNNPPEATDSTINPLLHFLEKGYWPWNFQQRPEKELTAILANILRDAAAVQQLFTWLDRMGTYANTRLMHFIATDPVLIKTFISALESRHPAFAVLISMLPLHWKKKAFEENSFYFLLITRLMNSPVLKDTAAITELVESLLPQYYPGAYLKKASLPKPRKPTVAVNPLHVLKNIFLLVEQQPTLKARDQSSAPQSLAGERNVEMEAYDETTGNPVEKISISNAGLVLFHPFLQAVFRDLDWLGADKKFIDGNAQRKAVLFLQYLVNGKSRQAEHQLVLNKILCGWPVHLPLPANARFSAKEKNAVTDLIESLKEHWPVVKNTSNRGLVESFVNRPGLLQQTEKGFLLQVERKSIDILLDSLPLNLNIIKLPWNEQIIYTEW